MLEKSSSELNRRRKKRTSIEGNIRNVLEDTFQSNPRPVPVVMEALAENLNLDREVVRVWFCNRRQKAKRQCPLSAAYYPGDDEVSNSCGFLLYTNHSRLPVKSNCSISDEECSQGSAADRGCRSLESDAGERFKLETRVE
ncbi:unnamed protein product [Soboliphyme baturini]|uniref:Homeobox domain-containing protein n=1 Tax=Soboliphyme baturini TaxID=241478 RepID=A0A183IS91_9BILA|nr:unnamed protein product [Soboliphyme baturini]